MSAREKLRGHPPAGACSPSPPDRTEGHAASARASSGGGERSVRRSRDHGGAEGKRSGGGRGIAYFELEQRLWDGKEDGGSTVRGHGITLKVSRSFCYVYGCLL